MMLTTFRIPASEPRFAPLVFLHAFPLSSAMWTEVLDLLRHEAPERDYLTVEFPGFGTSQPIHDWTMELFADELAATLTELGIARAVFAGMSMGGYAAFAFYRKHPDMVEGLMLSNTKPGADSDAAKKGRDEFIHDVESKGSNAASERMLPKFLVPAVQIDYPELEDKLKYWIHDASSESLIDALKAMRDRNDSTALLGEIRKPVLVIAGTEDSFFSVEDTKAWVTKIPLSECVVIDGAGHLSPIDKPFEWVQVVRSFLQRCGI